MAKQAVNGCVLLVDDEEAIRESLGELLGVCGFKVCAAASCDSAIKIIKARDDIEAIICDLKMPGKPGIELLRFLNKSRIRIPVVFLTGYGTLESCQEAMREGAFDYILKPIDDKDNVLMPLRHAVEKFRLEKNNQNLRLDIMRLAEEHQELLNQVLNDRETRDKAHQRISEIVEKWKTS